MSSSNLSAAITGFLAWVKTDSALILWSIQAAVTAAVAFGLHATPAQTAAVSVIAAAVVSVLTAFATRPVRVTVITGAVATIATAAGAFGLHASAAQIGALTPVLALVTALLLRSHVSPAAVASPAVAASPSGSPPPANPRI